MPVLARILPWSFRTPSDHWPGSWWLPRRIPGGVCWVFAETEDRIMPHIAEMLNDVWASDGLGLEAATNEGYAALRRTALRTRYHLHNCDNDDEWWRYRASLFLLLSFISCHLLYGFHFQFNINIYRTCYLIILCIIFIYHLYQLNSFDLIKHHVVSIVYCIPRRMLI